MCLPLTLGGVCNYLLKSYRREETEEKIHMEYMWARDVCNSSCMLLDGLPDILD